MKFIILFALLFLPFPVFSSETPEYRIVVTADRIETDIERVASSVTVITKERIQSSQYDSVSQILQEAPGIMVSNTRNRGQVSSVSIRGAGSGQVLVLIDGVKVNDPLNPSRSFDFSKLSLDQVERIEVIRGAQSVVYGSDAIGGIVHIITKKGIGPVITDLAAEYGSYRTLSSAASVSGGTRNFYYSFGGGVQETAGFSTASERLGNSEKDANFFSNMSARIGGKPAEKIDLDFSARYSYSKVDGDLSGGEPSAFGGDDPNFVTKDHVYSARLEAKTEYFGNWEPVLGFGYFLNSRRTDDEIDVLHSFASHYRYRSHRWRADWLNHFYLDDRNTVTFGLENEREQGTFQEFGSAIVSDKGNSVFGVFLQERYLSPTWYLTLGARADHHDGFGSHVTYRFAPGYRFAEMGTTLRSSFGTGFKAPTLYQLYAPVYGNAALEPEANLSFDVGIGQEFFYQRVNLSAAYFQNRFRQLIQFSDNRYRNIGSARSRGAELSGDLKMFASWSLSASYTYTSAWDEASDSPLGQIPRHQLSAESEHSFFDRLDLKGRARFIGRRLDAAQWMPSYAVFDLLGTYRAMGKFKIFARLENVSDRDYEEVYGYGTPGRTFALGFQKAF